MKYRYPICNRKQPKQYISITIIFILIKFQIQIRAHREPIEQLVLEQIEIINRDTTNQEQIRKTAVVADSFLLNIINYAPRRITHLQKVQ